jgi:hypothetical protein
MACACCGNSPDPGNCSSCLQVRSCADCISTASETHCAVPWIVSDELPCDSFWFLGYDQGSLVQPPDDIRDCSQYESNYPAAANYPNCPCLELRAECSRRAFTGSCNEFGQATPCFKAAIRYVVTYNLFVFDSVLCKWAKIAQNTYDSGVSVDYVFGSDCTGTPDPTIEACTPSACDGPYEGCECFP